MNLAAAITLETGKFLSGIREAQSGLGGLTGNLGGLLAPIAGITAGLAGVAATAKFMAAAIKEAASMEDFETSFETLLGSADAAKERLQILSDFAAQTPFELPEVARASRVLETLTRGALSTGAGLTLVGDIAASTQQPFSEMAVVIGRLYDGLQSGRPVGEAMARLQELGVISGDVRSRLEELQSEGVKGDAVWQSAAGAFSRFAGEMDRKSVTLNGRISTLSDSFKGLMREIGGPLLGPARDEISKLTSMIEEVNYLLKAAKGYWMDAFGVVRGGGAGGLEALTGLIARARALDTVAEKERLIADIKEEIIRLQNREAAMPTMDFTQSITQAVRLLEVIQAMPDAALRAADAQKQAAAELATMVNKAPEQNATIDGAKRAMLDARDRAKLSDPNADNMDREISATLLAQRATKGVLVEVPMNLDQARERLELEIELVENMRRHPEMMELAAKKAEGIADAYREVLSLQGQVGAIKSQSMGKAVSDMLAEIYGDANPVGMTSHQSGMASLGSMMTDRLTRIGGFIGGVGGPAVDFARRTAVATEQGLRKLDGIASKLSRFDQPGTGASWA